MHDILAADTHDGWRAVCDREGDFGCCTLQIDHSLVDFRISSLTWGRMIWAWMSGVSMNDVLETSCNFDSCLLI